MHFVLPQSQIRFRYFKSFKSLVSMSKKNNKSCSLVKEEGG